MKSSDYVGSLCQTCGHGTYVETEQGVECNECFGVAGIAGSYPPIRIIERKDKYNISIQGTVVRANDDQERRIREMTSEQLERFQKIMGGKQ